MRVNDFEAAGAAPVAFDQADEAFDGSDGEAEKAVQPHTAGNLGFCPRLLKARTSKCRARQSSARSGRGMMGRMGNGIADISPERLAEFEAASRRPLAQRWRYAFIRTHKPVMDDARFRAFTTTDEYRRWCESHLPRFLGYHRV